MVPEGKYRAKPTAHGFQKTKSGAIQAAICFDVNGDSVWWTSTLQPEEIGRTNFTRKTLQSLGFGPGAAESWEEWSESDFTRFEHGEGLDYEKPLEIIVEHNQYNEKTYARVKYINVSHFERLAGENMMRLRAQIGLSAGLNISHDGEMSEIPF